MGLTPSLIASSKSNNHYLARSESSSSPLYNNTSILTEEESSSSFSTATNDSGPYPKSTSIISSPSSSSALYSESHTQGSFSYSNSGQQQLTPGSSIAGNINICYEKTISGESLENTNPPKIITMALSYLSDDAVFKELSALYKEKAKSLDMRELFQNDPNRFKKFRYEISLFLLLLLQNPTNEMKVCVFCT
jgi:hypothetical protein